MDYKTIPDNLKTGIIVCDFDLNVQYSNDAFERIFPHTPKDSSLGEATGCPYAAPGCGEAEECEDCTLRGAFENAFLSQSEQRVSTTRQYVTLSHETPERASSYTEYKYDIDVVPIGGGLCMGTIEDPQTTKSVRNAGSLQRALQPKGRYYAGKRFNFLSDAYLDVGGDLFDAYEADGCACGYVADVAGKGVEAGFIAAFVRGAMNKSISSPSKTIQNLFDRFKDTGFDETHYVTMAAVKIDSENVYCSMAGHNAPILLKTRYGVTRIIQNAPPISNWFDDFSYYEDVIPYEEGDILVLLTDGVTELRDENGNMFGEDGATRVLSVSKTGSDFKENLKDAIADFSPEKRDDITAVAIDL